MFNLNNTKSNGYFTCSCFLKDSINPLIFAAGTSDGYIIVFDSRTNF